MKPSKRATTLASALVLTLLAAACGGGGGATDATAPPGDGGADLSGEVVVSGSSTVEPITRLVSEMFQAEHQGVAFDVTGPGTGDGFERFCNGETDISDASRAIQDEEADACAANGIEWIELYVAIDGLSTITSVDNTDIGPCLSFTDIYAIVGPESNGFETWAAANDLATELGGTVAAPFPDVPLSIHAPGEESGTYDSFIEIVLEGVAEERGVEDVAPRLDYQSYPEDVEIISNIVGPPATTFGWVGYSFYVQSADEVRAFEVDGGDGCVAPTPETIADGSYPISRPLYIYVSAAAAERPEVAAFVDYFMSEAGREAVEDPDVGYVNLPQDEWDASAQRWVDRVTGAAAG